MGVGPNQTIKRAQVRLAEPSHLCEGLMGTLRLECLDFLNPLSEDHLWRILRERPAHHNRGRPHTCPRLSSPRHLLAYTGPQ
jgi:hypothetical protein